MAEVNMGIRYLDYKGLQTLWTKISETFLRDSEVAAAIAADDTIKGLSGRIKEIEDSQGANVDGRTIIKDSDGVLQTNLALWNDNTKHELHIIVDGETDENGNPTKSSIVSTWNYNDFYNDAVKDGILESVSLVVVPDQETEAASGQEAGTYLKFEFKTSNGIDSIYVNVTELVDVYVGSDYILVNKNDDGDTQISLDTAKLVEDLQDADVFGITSLVTSVNDIDVRLKVIEDLDLTSMKNQVDANKADLDALKTRVDALPTITAIPDDDIAGLQ